MAANGRYVVGLSELSRADLPIAGGKAANLGELLRAGFRVPEGFVLSTNAFARFVEFHGFGPTAQQADVAGAALPDDVAEAMIAAHASVADAPLAVRSSGVAEDLPGASFAGQYDTLLGIRGTDALARAVTRCWASAFSDRVTTYRPGRVSGGVPPMAVLVQRLVEPDAAGVVFTANPLTGDRTEVVISAVRGLGDRLVSGTAQPDEWIVRDGRATSTRTVEGALEGQQAALVAETARQIEAHFGEPQDVEWALARGELFVLQARPVTALPAQPADPVAVPLDVPDGFWQREVTHFPRPMTPMASDLLPTLHNPAFREMFTTYGLLLEGIEMREIGGWVYARAVPLGGKDRKAPPPPVMWLLARTVPPLRERIRTCRAAIRSDQHGRDIERWHSEWKPDLARRIEALAAVDLTELSAGALEAHVDEVLLLGRDCLRLHFRLHGAMLMVLSEFGFACRDLLAWDDLRMLELLDGLSEMSSEPSRRLADLARMAAQRQVVGPLLAPQSGGSLERVRAADGEFADAFEAYRREFGCRALAYDLVEPTLAERPELVLQLIRDQISRGYNPAADAEALAGRRSTALAEARSVLAGRAADVARFERVLQRAERAYPVREDSEFYTISAPLGVIRYAALELGRRLASRELIDAADDVFFLTFAEARAALASGEAQHPLVARRRGERAWVLAHPGAASYGKDPGPPPATHVLPGEASFAMEALQWAMLDRILAPEQSQQAQERSDCLTGIAASTGAYTGPVRVVMDETEFAKVRAGDVLVCPVTSPVWSVLFPSIGALVTDTGGTLSHAAIIAREYRLPAVVGTGNATALLRDGQLVAVDGDGGLVLTITGQAPAASADGSGPRSDAFVDVRAVEPSPQVAAGSPWKQDRGVSPTSGSD